MRLGGISYHWQGKGNGLNQIVKRRSDEVILAKEPICPWHLNSDSGVVLCHW